MDPSERKAAEVMVFVDNKKGDGGRGGGYEGRAGCYL